MKPKILVVGDAMVDQYHFGIATRVSAEAPVPVVKITDHQTFHGGAANVFTNLVALGAEAKLCAGDPTPVKNRLMVGTTQVARWDTNDEVHPIEVEQLDQAMLHWTPDAIIISDYDKGSITPEVISWVYDQGVHIYIDTKKDPFSFYDSLRNGDPYETWFPNQAEYQQYKNNYDAEPYVIYKRGALGIQHLSFGDVQGDYPATARQVVSVCGAGDTVIAAYAYFATLGDPDALHKANTAAAIVVEKPWTATVSLAEIDERIKCLVTKKD